MSIDEIKVIADDAQLPQEVISLGKTKLVVRSSYTLVPL